MNAAHGMTAQRLFMLINEPSSPGKPKKRWKLMLAEDALILKKQNNARSTCSVFT